MTQNTVAENQCCGRSCRVRPGVQAVDGQNLDRPSGERGRPGERYTARRYFLNLINWIGNVIAPAAPVAQRSCNRSFAVWPWIRQMVFTAIGLRWFQA